MPQERSVGGRLAWHLTTDREKYDIAQGRWRITTSAYPPEFRTASGRLHGPSSKATISIDVLSDPDP